MINKRKFRIKPGMRRGWTAPSPLPTRLVSNEEFPPVAQTFEQAQVERIVAAMGEQAGRRLGMNRREFLKTSGGMAAAFLAMNSVFGRFFDVLDVDLVEAAAFEERSGAAPFILDLQTHYVSANYDPQGEEGGRKGAIAKQTLLDVRRRAREAGMNPKLKNDRGTIQDLSW